MTKPTKCMCAQRRLRSAWASAQSDQSLRCLGAPRDDSDQTGWMPRLIWVFAGRTYHFIGFVTMRLNSLSQSSGLYLSGTGQTKHSCNWARSRENVFYAICEQQRCTSALIGTFVVRCLNSTIRIPAISKDSRFLLASVAEQGGFESYLVENPRRHVFAWWVSTDWLLV